KLVTELNKQELNNELSFFEVLFLIALLYFKNQQVSIALLETGLGGRLDATNAVKSELSLLSRIDYDHCDILGNTLPEIASEKAGIIKSNPVIALKQKDEVNDVFSRFAQKNNSKLAWVNADACPEDINAGQWENSHLALAAAKHLDPSGKFPDLLSLAKSPLAGRQHSCEYGGDQYLLDVAHNEVSIKLLCQKLTKFNTKVQLLYAMADSRDSKKLLSLLAPHINCITFTDLPGGRPGIEPEELSKTFQQIDSHIKPTILRHQEGIRKWIEAPVNGGLKLVCGSFYLVGAVMDIMNYDAEKLYTHSSSERLS
ncbi:MAG: hypothetical protein HQL32_10110, partial [Planctomycetes bacterium]|nr:hypothetical protein [Planctomycetota bacterium]